MMKLPMKKFEFLLTFLFIGAFLYIQGPSIVKNFSNEDKTIAPKTYSNLSSPGQTVLFPPAGRSMAIFWATWCGPCKIEMNRLKKSVENGQIDPKKIFAINPFESTLEVQGFLQKEKFPFIFIDAPEITRHLDIRLTPTTLWLEGSDIQRASSGISFVGIWRAEAFLNK